MPQIDENENCYGLNGMVKSGLRANVNLTLDVILEPRICTGLI
jgi:hypothetical protein